MNLKLFPLASALCVLTMPALAEAPSPQTIETDFLVLAGLTYGGDDLYQVEYEDGSDTELKAGGLISVGAGLITHFNQYSIQTTLAYHFDSADADNGDVSFSRWSLELLPFYNIDDKHRVGLGLTYHMSPELESDFDFDKSTIEFDSAVGIVAEYGYSWDQSTVGVRFVSIDYDISELNGMDVGWADVSVSGNHLGVYYYYNF